MQGLQLSEIETKMKSAIRNLQRWVLLFVFFAFCVSASDADLRTTMKILASDDNAAKKTAIDTLGHSRDMRVAAFLDDYSQGNVYLWKDLIVLAPSTRDNGHGVKVAPLFDPLLRLPILTPTNDAALLSALKEVSAGRRERGCSCATH